MPAPRLPVFNIRVIAYLRTQVNSLDTTMRNMNMQRVRPMLALRIFEQRALYNAQLNAGVSFLHNLTVNPKYLVEQLKEKIFASLVDFELAHPAGQSINLRHTLSNLKIAYCAIDMQVQQISNSGAPASSSDYHCPYLQCCGALAAAFQAHENDNDKLGKSFRKMILSLLEKTYIDFNGDLPDRWEIGESAMDHFYSHHTMPDRLTFQRNEEYKFQLVRNQLEVILRINPTVMQNAYVIKLAKSIEQDFVAASAKPDFDIKFATQALSMISDLLQSPDDANMYTLFRPFLDHASGKPSIYKKMAGFFLVVTGLAIIAAGIFLGVTTGIGPHAVWIAGAGVAVSGEGIRLFQKGMRQGTSQSMFNLFHLAKTLTPASSSQQRVEPQQVASTSEFKPFTGTRFKLG